MCVSGTAKSAVVALQSLGAVLSLVQSPYQIVPARKKSILQ